MNRLIDVLFSAPLLPALVRLVHALLAPTLRALQLDDAALAAVLVATGRHLRGTPGAESALAPYTVAEVHEIAASLATLLRGVADAFGFQALTDVRLAQLLDGVAERVAA